MSFLPVVERELRVAARRRPTYWARVGTAAFALVIFGSFVGIYQMEQSGMVFGTSLGYVLFEVFSWLSFAAVCTAGVFLTADSLSEEKREGTLGLLFLTDLRGHDVVLGKLVSHSVVATYALLAALPIVGLSFFMGGVTGGEFVRLVLVLLNTLFFSLTAGVLVSAVSVDGQQSMTRCAALCALFIIVLPVVDWALADWKSATFQVCWSLASPGFAMSEARSLFLGDFWTAMAVVHGIGWGFLVAACLLAPRHWQDKARSQSGPASRSQRMRFGSATKRVRLRVLWLAENPVRWLAGRDLWMGRFLWIALLAMALGGVLLSVWSNDRDVYLGVGNGVTGLLLLLMNLWVAALACRFFAEAMRTGTIELLLVTPLPPRQIILGQWWALCRTFVRPVLVLMLCEAAFAAWQIQNMAQQHPEMWPDSIIHLSITHAGNIVAGASGLVAVAWFGMWMGLRSRKPNHAILKTLVLVQVLPWLGLMIGLIVLQLASNNWGGGFSYWFSQLVMLVVAVAIDIAFIIVARRRLLRELREVAARGDAEPPRSSFLPWRRRKAPLVLPTL